MRVADLEKKTIDPDRWDEAPPLIRLMAQESSGEGIPTAIGHDEVTGWFILQTGQGPFVSFAERPDMVED